MTVVGQSLKSITVRGFNILVKIRLVLIGLSAIGLGVLYGYLIDSAETGELIISIVVVIILMVIIVNNPLNGLLIWLFFTAFVETWINIPMGAGIPDMEFSRFIVAFLSIFMLAQAAIGRFRFARIGLVDVYIIATTLGIMMCAPLSVHPKDTLQLAISMHFVPLSLYFFAKNLVQDKEDLDKLFLVITLFGFVAASYMIYEQTTGNILFLAKGEALSLAEAHARMYGFGLRVVQGLVGSGANFGRVLVSTLPITFYLFFEGKSVTRKILLVGMIIVQAYGMFLTYNRTSWYSLLISLSILQFFYPQFRKAYLVIVLMGAMTLWATWDQVTDSTVVTQRINSKVSTLEGREERWRAGYNMWQAKPIRGWGFDRFQTESGRFRTDGSHYNITAIENDYLHLLVASGLMGFLPYVLFLLTPLFTSLRLFFRARAPDWSGFVKPEAIAIYWAIILSFAIGSYSQIQTQQIVKMIPFAVAGAVVGTHEHWLRRPKLHSEVTNDD